jgi:hypothetical protein
VPAPYVVSLVGVVIVLIVVRLAVRWRPGRPWARSISTSDLALVIVGAVGLAFHCTAMFYRGAVSVIPGTQSTVAAINAMGLTSVLLFAAPAVLLVIGLRRQYVVVLTLVLASLVGVGITMYDSGPLSSHLAAIFISVVVLAVIGTQLIAGPTSPSRKRAQAA